MKPLMRLLLIVVLLLIPSLVFASPIPYSGQLTEGGVLISGNRNITLSVYAGPFGGSPLYTQTETLPIVVGIYHTMINAPNATWDGSDRWIGVAVNGGVELSPRVKVGWVPYAVYTPRPSPILVFRPSTFAIVSDQWTKVDSLTITAPTAGVLNINATGFGVWAGPGAQSSAGLAISEATPTEPLTVLRAISGSDAFSMTLITLVTPGTRTYYVWGYNAAVGGTYSIGCQRFQALFIPN